MPARQVAVAEAARPFFVGIDLGGTNTKLGVVDDQGRVVAQHKMPSQIEQGPEAGARRMGEAVRQLLQELGISAAEVGRVGLGTPGTMDIPAGMLIRPHNLPGWENFPIRDRVSHYCGYPVTFANDAAAAAYGEYWVGSGHRWQSMLLLTLGTGIGGGIVIGQLNIQGAHSHGAECGHIIIDYNETARTCPCGQKGHLEGYASATAVVQRLEEALAQGAETSLRRRVEQGEKLSPLLLAQEAEKGDSFALNMIQETARYLGIGITSLLHTIDPEGVVLGGAMNFGGAESPLGRQFLQWVREEIQRRAFPVVAQNLNLEFASLGGDAGFIGAAGLARIDYRQSRAAL